MSNPGFKLYTCDCGEIVIQFTPDVDPEVKKEMSLKGYDVVDPEVETYCCKACRADIEIGYRDQ